MTPFWKILVVTTLVLQVVLLGLGLYVADDVYQWARWSSQPGYDPATARSYYSTDGGLKVAETVGLTVLLAVIAIGGAAATNRLPKA